MPPKRKAATASKRRSKKEESSSEEDVSSEEIEEEIEERPAKKSNRINNNKVAKEAEDAGARKLGLEWVHENDTLYVLSSSQLKPSSKVIGFDMDGTIVYPKSGAKFPQNRQDWAWFNDRVPTKLKELNKDGYKVVVFTNQAGIEKNKQNPNDLKGKLIDLSVELGFPLQAFIAAATDLNRKPNTTMWDVFCEKYNGGVEIDMKASMYVGDAAGRAKEWKAGAKKDFSCSDRSFALNAGLTFKTPEEYFLDEKPAKFQFDSVDPEAVLKELQSAKMPDEKVIHGDGKQEMIIMVGRPASGKSTFAKKYFVDRGYVHVNQDILKTKPKCIKTVKEALLEGKSVVVDNTCPSASARAEFTKLAEHESVPYRCFEFTTSVDLAHHLNFFREKVTNGGVRRIPDIAYNMFKSKYEEPSKSEGFSEVHKISWCPDFKDDNMKRLFLQRT